MGKTRETTKTPEMPDRVMNYQPPVGAYLEMPGAFPDYKGCRDGILLDQWYWVNFGMEDTRPELLWGDEARNIIEAKDIEIANLQTAIKKISNRKMAKEAGGAKETHTRADALAADFGHW